MPEPSAILRQYCYGCHNQKLKSGNLALDALDAAHVGQNPAVWEKVVKKLRAGVRVSCGIDDAQRDYLRWHARIMARRNGSINHLQEHFISLCKGYTITYSDHVDTELSARLEAISLALD